MRARKRVRKLGAGINLGGVRDLNRVGAVVGEREKHVIMLCSKKKACNYVRAV